VFDVDGIVDDDVVVVEDKVQGCGAKKNTRFGHKRNDDSFLGHFVLYFFSGRCIFFLEGARTDENTAI